MLTDTELAAIRERCEKATTGPWYIVNQPWTETYTYVIAGHRDPHLGTPVLDSIHVEEVEEGEDEDELINQSWLDCEFAAQARTDVPKLLECIEELKKQIIGYKKMAGIVWRK